MVRPIEEPPAKDVRTERFCQAIARGISVDAAMVEAGYAPACAKQNGLKVLRRQHVKARIALLCKKQGLPTPQIMLTLNSAEVEEIDLSMITPEWMFKEVVATYLLAKKQFNVGAMVKLIDQIGRMSGYIKRPTGHPGHQKDPNKGDVSNDKPQPENPIGFEAFVEATGGDGSDAGDEFTPEDFFDAGTEDDTSEIQMHRDRSDATAFRNSSS